MGGYFGIGRLVVGFTGSRQWQPGAELQGAFMAVHGVFRTLDGVFAASQRAPVLVVGDAAGVDAWAREEARKRRWPVVCFTPAWCEGRSAGPERNEWMVELLADHDGTLYGIWNGASPGARGCIQRAIEAAVALHRWTPMYQWQGWNPAQGRWALFGA